MPQFEGCGCSPPHMEIMKDDINTAVCTNAGCNATWKKAGAGWMLTKKPDHLIPDAKPSSPETKSDGDPLNALVAKVTEKLSKDQDPDTVALLNQMKSQILGTQEDEVKTESVMENSKEPEVAAEASAVAESKPDSSDSTFDELVKSARGGANGLDDRVILAKITALAQHLADRKKPDAD
jgi:hypothetical protein